MTNWIMNALANIVAVLAYIIVEPARYLWRHEYSGWTGALLRAPLGFLVGTGAGIAAAQWTGWGHDAHWMVTTAAGFAAWFATFVYLWPASCRWVFRPVFDVAEDIYDALRQGTRKYAEPVFGGIVDVLSFLPGSGAAWTAVKAKKDGWFNELVLILANIGCTIGAGWTAWEVWYIVETFSASFGIVGWVGDFVFGPAAAILTFATLGGLAWQLIKYGKLPFVAVGLGGGLTWLFSGELLTLAGLAGVTGAAVYAALPVAFVAFVAYIYPLVSWALGGDFFKWLIEKKVKPLCEAAYDDENKDYRKFYRHVVTLVATAAVGIGAFLLAGSIALPLWAVWTVAVVAGICAYLGVFELIDHNGEVILSGVVASGYTAWLAGSAYMASGLPGGWYMTIAAAILAFLGMVFVAFPAAYWLVKFVVTLVRLEKLGTPLAWIHDQAEKGARWVGKKFEVVYDSSYRDRTGYQSWFLHAANLVVTYGVFTGMAWFGLSTWVTLALAVPAAALSYILVGKFLQKSNVGVEFIGSLVAIGFAIETGTRVHAVFATPFYWAAVASGFFAACVAFCIAFPAVYLAARLVLRPLLASWTSRPLVWVHDLAWDAFSGFWTIVMARLEWLVEFMRPFWAAVARAWKRVADAYARLRDRIMNRKAA